MLADGSDARKLGRKTQPSDFGNAAEASLISPRLAKKGN